MTYQDHLELIKRTPLTEPFELKKRIGAIRDKAIAQKICAKWFSLVIGELKHLKQPEPPMDVIDMRQRRGNQELYQSYMKLNTVQEFLHLKDKVCASNYRNFSSLKWCLDGLDESENPSKVIDKMREFIVKYKEETEKPYVTYDYVRDLDTETKSRIYPETFQRQDYEGHKG